MLQSGVTVATVIIVASADQILFIMSLLLEMINAILLIAVALNLEVQLVLGRDPVSTIGLQGLIAVLGQVVQLGLTRVPRTILAITQVLQLVMARVLKPMLA